MKVIFWNLRGLKRQKAKDKLYNLVNSNNPSLVWVTEPKIKFKKNISKLPGMNYKIIHNASDDKNIANIWLFWNCTISPPSVIASSRQCITVEIGRVLVTGVHANSYTVNRRELWQELCDISLLNKSRLLLGDFNSVLSVNEKKGGRCPLYAAMRDYQDCVNFCGLIQAPKSGLEFSWCNGRAGSKRILCNLDRAFFNLKWLDFFNGWHYHVGTRGISDHAYLIGSDTIIPRATNIPFRFQKMWLSHPSFMKVVLNSWNEELVGNPIFVFMNKIKRLKKIFKIWNWEVFGDVKVNLTTAEEKVMATTLASDNNPSDINLLNKLVTARGEYDIATNNYHTFLRDKARHNWIQQDDNCLLEQIPDVDEIKTTVFELNQDGAPGPDGFTGVFYRATLDIISYNLVDAIQFCWQNNLIPSGMNSYFLVLIPKLKGAKNAKNFRPIGLSNFCLKIITKIITVRLSKLMHKIISPQQFAFIKGRNIHEQALLASELVNEMSTTRRGGNLSLKLDISQAYDTMSWEFLYRTMKKLGFSAKFCNCILVLKSSKISIMLNGGPIGFFGIGRGLKHPLSPILFIIAEDVLSRNIQKMVIEHKIQPMVVRNGFHPTHLLFADDILLFCNGSKRSITNLKSLLVDYQAASGQIINADKSKCFVHGTSDTRRRQIAAFFHMNLSCYPDKYLGVMLVQGKIKSIHLWHLVEYMQSSLTAWSGRLLNFQARLTLVKHVLCSIPVYNMSIYRWPRKVIAACERIIRNYLWSGNADEQKCVTLKWKKVCSPMEEGGLGIRKL
ncbi:uncharacterized protein LOC113279438 [Papaver somniferum]|uniref:uncharacterized protein LOC113279438 n=1 Tax=Papaver somniferum TaxID=3469 RepID=UPI000E6FE3D2|nr:uncharacterized protein LOC113279438 [Papaver somniferum]